MKKLYFFIIVLSSFSLKLNAQASSCANAVEFCTSSNYYFSNVTGVGSIGGGGVYGCVNSTPNAKWFYMQVTTSGNIIFTINQTDLGGTPRDVDFVCWGPFASPGAGCTVIGDTLLGAGAIVSCGYTGSASEVCTINGAVAGNYYVLLCTNYSNLAGNITFVQSPNSTGTSQCTSSCSVSSVTAVPTACNAPSNTYILNGQINFTSPPATGILTVSTTGGGSVTFNAPFTNPVNYSIPNLQSTGTVCTVHASFSDEGSCFQTATYTAPIPCIPCTVAISNNGPLCVGAALNLTATAVTGGTYAWTGPNGFTSNVQNPTIPSVTMVDAGTYTLVVTVTANGMTCSHSTNVLIHPAPIVTVNSPTICSGQTVTLNAISPSQGGSFLWSPTNDTASSISITPSADTSFIVGYTLAGCTNTGYDTAMITVIQRPTVTCNSTSICVGQSAVLTASPSAPGGTYYWSNSGQTTQSIAVTPTATTAYLVFYTLNGCANTVAGIVSIITTPVITLNSTTICDGATATLTASAVPLGGTYTWAGGLGSNAGISVSPSSTSTYTVTYTSVGCANTATDSATVTVNPSPSVTSNSDTMCSGESVTLTAVSSPAGGSYSWSDGGLTQSTVVNPFSSTTYTVTYTLAGCSASYISSVTVNPIPSTPVIAQNGMTLTSSASTGNQWYMNNSSITSATGSTYLVSQNGTYYVIVSNNGCSSDTSAQVVINNIGITELSDANLFTIYPNPASSVSTLYYSLKSGGMVNIEVDNRLGEKVHIIVNNQQQRAGEYRYEFSLSDTGIYLVKMQTEQGTSVKRVVFLQ